jgi:hypothetical protein
MGSARFEPIPEVTALKYAKNYKRMNIPIAVRHPEQPVLVDGAL